jgi:DinB superfamily
MPRLSENRESVLRQLQMSEYEAAQLIQGVSRDQGNWQPVAGKSWSIWQCLDHLALTNRLYSHTISECVSKHIGDQPVPTTEIRPGWFGRWFISQLEPPVRLRFKTLPKITPAVNGDLEEVLKHFVESHEETREVLKLWDRVDFNNLRFRSPFASLLTFSAGTGLLIITAHDRRHLWQAQRVKEAPGYPKD